MRPGQQADNKPKENKLGLPEILPFKKGGAIAKPEESKKPAFGGKFGMQMRKQGGMAAISNAVGETESVKPDPPIEPKKLEPVAVIPVPEQPVEQE